MCEKKLLLAVNFNSQCESRDTIYTATAPFQGGKKMSFFKHCIQNNKHWSQKNSSVHLIVSSCVFFKSTRSSTRLLDGEVVALSIYQKAFFFFFSSFLQSLWQLFFTRLGSILIYASPRRGTKSEGSAAVCNIKQSSLTLSKWSSGRGRPEEGFGSRVSGLAG